MTPIPFTPTDAAGHAGLGDWYAQAGKLTEAQAQYRTALALGLAAAPDRAGVMLRLAQAYLLLGRPELATIWCDRLETLDPSFMASARTEVGTGAAAARPTPLKTLDHNRFWRMRTLAAVLAEISAGAQGDNLSVLDIGGGDGLLALFLPEIEYVLAEPGTNGITAQDLPFAGGAFDVVLSCHVLEHIPAPQREAFLDTLCRLARREVVLLNPFQAENTDGDPWLETVWELTRAPWAKEHLDCGFPALNEVEAYAAARGYGCRCTPNGLRAVSTLHVLLSHYAAQAGRPAQLERINGLLNDLDESVLDSGVMPTAWLVRIDVSS